MILTRHHIMKKKLLRKLHNSSTRVCVDFQSQNAPLLKNHKFNTLVHKIILYLTRWIMDFMEQLRL